MSEYKAYFDGHDLTTLFEIAPPEREMVTWEPRLVDMPSGYGSQFVGTSAQSMKITLELTTFSETLEQRLNDLHTLAGWLAVNEPKKLFLYDEQEPIAGAYMFRYAVPTGTPQIAHAYNAATATVSFICPDPRTYVTSNYYSEPFSRVAARFYGTDYGSGDVECNAPVEAKIFVSGAYGDANGKFALRVECWDNHTLMTDYGGTITLDIPSDTPKTVYIRSDNRTCTIGGIAKPLPLENDWIIIRGGVMVQAKVIQGGCTEGTVSYSPRWW